jgi:hypothetical protein
LFSSRVSETGCAILSAAALAALTVQLFAVVAAAARRSVAARDAAPAVARARATRLHYVPAPARASEHHDIVLDELRKRICHARILRERNDELHRKEQIDRRTLRARSR